jgi:hypothetical protein
MIFLTIVACTMCWSVSRAIPGSARRLGLNSSEEEMILAFSRVAGVYEEFSNLYGGPSSLEKMIRPGSLGQRGDKYTHFL